MGARLLQEEIYKIAQERLFFCNVENVCSKAPIRYVGWGPPQGPTFVSAVPTLNKIKKQKLKKQPVLFRTVIAKKHFGARCENAKYFIAITVLNKTCNFYSFCFSVLFILGTVHTKAGP